MTIRCSNCSRENSDTSPYCLTCGTMLAPGAPAGALPSRAQPAQNNAQFAVPSGFFFPQAPPQSSPRGNTSASQPFQVFAQQSEQAAKHPIVPMGTRTSSLVGARRAFAGYGISTTHQSWLLSTQAARANDVFSAVLETMHQRDQWNIKLQPAKLQEQGIQPEERYYLIVQRGVSTVFIYIAPSGNDLYISRATSVKRSLDAFRLIILAILFGGAFFLPIIGGSVAAGTTTNTAYGPVYTSGNILLSILFSLISICCWIYLLWQGIRSLRYWIREKDFLIYLRNLTLKDFEMDDIMLLEHATDETIRDALKQLNLDANLIVPPTQGYQPQRRLRVL